MAPAAEPLPSPDIDPDTINRAYALACDLVDRERQALVAELPDMNASKHMQPIEAWFLWGVFFDFFDGDRDRAEAMLAWYLHHRRRIEVDGAAWLARDIRQTSTEGNCFFDSVANGGREASRSGSEGCFISAARFIQQALAKSH